MNIRIFIKTAIAARFWTMLQYVKIAKKNMYSEFKKETLWYTFLQ